MEIISSNNSDWVGLTVNVKDSNKVKVLKMGFFSSDVKNEYKNSQIVKFVLGSSESQISKNKQALGTVGGAMVGGLLTGGVGAIVGGLACGNKTSTKGKQQIGLQFDDGSWLLAVGETGDSIKGTITEYVVKELSKRFASKTECPF